MSGYTLEADSPDFTRIDGVPVGADFNRIIEGRLLSEDGLSRDVRFTLAPTFVHSAVEVGGETIACKSAWVRIENDRPVSAGYRRSRERWMSGGSPWLDISGRFSAEET